MNAALDPLAAQLLLRAYARATNMLIAGRSFSTDDPTLAALLRAFGAHVRPLSSVEETPASPPVVFALEEDAAPRPGAITVLAPGGVFRAVVAPDGRTITGPGDEGRIEWARAHMPVTEAAARALAPLVAGRSVGLSLVLEPKTAALALMLSEAGARVSVFGWASETREDVAAHLRDAGIPVFADSSASREREWQLARDFLAQRSEFLLDDGSHLIRLAHDTQRCPGVLDALVGAAEETTSGLRPLRSFDLRIPVMASNDARSKTLFDNAYGTGQSCWTTILDLIDPRGVGAPVAGMSVVVIGYGDVGRGCARFGAALGARVTVVEVDPVRALQASMDGFTVASLEEATPGAGMLISATGASSTWERAAGLSTRSRSVALPSPNATSTASCSPASLMRTRTCSTRAWRPWEPGSTAVSTAGHALSMRSTTRVAWTGEATRPKARVCSCAAARPPPPTW